MLVAPVKVRPSKPAGSAVHVAVSDWREAVRAGDWPAVAAGIDALPEAARAEPGTRYVRAVAAHRSGDCEGTLRAGDGLASRVPVLRAEVESMLRECRLVLGAAEAKGEHVSLEARLSAARFAARAGAFERAMSILDPLCAELARSARASQRELFGRAREQRAQIAERLGRSEQAERDYRWLALEFVSPDADRAYERLAGRRLSPEERLRRAEALAQRGRVAEVDRELDLAASAPGAPASDLERLRTRALAHYNSRASYPEAARLYEEVARLSHGARTSDLFRAANAWIKSGELERGVATYDGIRRRHRGSPAAERALYRKAQALYATGRWEAAVQTYTDYLDRHGGARRRGRFVHASVYERSVAELARGNSAAALAGLERLRGHRRTGYASRSIEHLEAVALAASGQAALEGRAVQRFEQLAEDHPLSFVALASAARLRQMGKEPPRLPDPPPQHRSSVRAELPLKVQLLLDLGLDTAAERALHEVEAELRAEYAGQATEILCDHYASVDRGYRRYRVASAAVSSKVLRQAPTAATAWAWQCLYPRPYAAAVESLERDYELPPGLLHSVMRQESAFRPDVRSPAGAVGLMQIMPRTAALAARELGVEHRGDRLTRPSYNLRLGAFYLSKLMNTFERRLVLALASYNAGPHAVSRWLSGAQGLDADLWAARIPYAETRRYVARVVANWARYRYLAGGSEDVPELSLELPSVIELPPDAY